MKTSKFAFKINSPLAGMVLCETYYIKDEVSILLKFDFPTLFPTTVSQLL